MNRFGVIKRTVKAFLVEVFGIGGTTQNRFISPKGLFSKPKNENALVISLSKSRNQDVVIALQKDVELEDGDVYLTDDKNFIHFHYSNGVIEIKGDTIFDDNVTVKKDLTVEGKIVCNTTIEAGTSVTAPNIVGNTDVTGGGVSLKSHTHTGDSGGTTSPPN